MDSRGFCSHVYPYLVYGIWQLGFTKVTKTSTTLEILAKVKVGIFAEENFSEFSFAIHDPIHKNLFRKKLKSIL